MDQIKIGKFVAYAKSSKKSIQKVTCSTTYKECPPKAEEEAKNNILYLMIY